MTNPSGLTAVAAGVLALAGSAYWALETWAGLVSAFHRSDPERTVVHVNDSVDYYPAGIWIGWIALVEVTLATVLLLIGGVLLLLRRSAGRWLILVGCVAVVAVLVHPLLASDYYYRAFSSYSFLYGVPAVLTAALALTPSTGRWCRPRAA